MSSRVLVMLPLAMLLLLSTSPLKGVVAQFVTSGVACPVATASVAQSPVKFDFTSVADRVTISTTQCPPYDTSTQSTGNSPMKDCLTYSYNYPPILNAYANRVLVGVYIDLAQTSLTPIPQGGPIGIAINGVAVYSNTDAEKRDAFVYEGDTFDTCAGHASPDGIYHYHAETTQGCVFNDTTGKHSPLFAVMADGFGLYGHFGDNGTVPTDLDECNGHSDASYPFYHYHLPYPYHTYPYTLNCLRGCIATDALAPPTDPVCQPATNNYGTDYTLFRAALEAVSVSNYNCSTNVTATSSSTGTTTGGPPSGPPPSAPPSGGPPSGPPPSGGSGGPPTTTSTGTAPPTTSTGTAPPTTSTGGSQPPPASAADRITTSSLVVVIAAVITTYHLLA